MAATTRKRCEDVEVGDLVRVLGDWCRVVRLFPYEGKLLSLLGEGTRVAKFHDGSGMTLSAGDYVEVA